MKANRSELPFQERVAVIWCGLEETVRAADNPEVAIADFFQVTIPQLRAWRAAEGRQCCPGVTTRGHTCRNYVSSVIDYDPRAWESRPAEYCSTHLKAQQDPGEAPALDPSVRGSDRNAASEDDARSISG